MLEICLRRQFLRASVKWLAVKTAEEKMRLLWVVPLADRVVENWD